MTYVKRKAGGGGGDYDESGIVYAFCCNHPPCNGFKTPNGWCLEMVVVMSYETTGGETGELRHPYLADLRLSWV